MYVVYGKPSTPVATKSYVVNDASQDRTCEYNVSGMSVESCSLNTGNTARGAASTTAGTKTWVVDANRKVDVELLADELDATIGLIADDLAAARR